MRTNVIKAGTLSTLFFEIGLALKLNKISAEEAIKFIPVEKIKNLAEKIDEAEGSNWDDSEITPGGRLRAALELQEMSQSELARALKVKAQKINDLISGRINFTVNWAKKIGTVLDINYKVFI
jgi:hypothetical protein